jgi:catechol 2,3-dioxygenase-like lactoylglutathione lyase family enzyme
MLEADSMEPMSAIESAPDLVPELLVGALGDSLAFWRRLCGFEVLYDRPEEGFAYITRGTTHVMLEQAGVGRNWTPAALERPLGRGINFQISVVSIDPILSALRDADWPLFMEPETKWYRTHGTEAGVVQFLVQDPDGYLIRFQSSLGQRSAGSCA